MHLLTFLFTELLQLLRSLNSCAQPFHLCLSGPCSEKSASPREGRGHTRRRRSAVGNTWAGWGLIPVLFSPWHGRSSVSHPNVRGPFPSKEIRRMSERDDPGPPVALSVDCIT
jgi:hypothetical protein